MTNTPPSHSELAAYLDVFASIPDTIGWYVVALESRGLLLIADARESMPLPVMEALAGKAGEVVAIASKPGTTWAGCLIRPAVSDIADAAGTLRAAYAIATTDHTSDDDTGPF